MEWRDPGVLVLGAAGAGVLLLPGRGLLGPALWFGRPSPAMMIAMALVIFCAAFFGTLWIWKMLTGERLQRPLPGILAVFLAVRLVVDCARIMMWR